MQSQLCSHKEKPKEMGSIGETPVQESYPMKGGDGTYSYAKNSSFQRRMAIVVKEKIDMLIAEKLDLQSLLSTSKTFRVADLGCSIGPNTFIAVQNITEAVERKYKSQSHTSQLPEFQVFFNDHALNDFNTLFTTLPPDRKYFAAGVPGSFHGRLFPESSLHFIYSSTALQWLSKVPEELLDNNSPAYNKGRIHYTSAPDNVVDAYATQFAKDMEIFFDARAKELVPGGIMVIIIACTRTGIPLSQTPVGMFFNFLESSFVDMAKEGIISEALVNSFNVPVYTTTLEEMTELVERNGCFNIEKMESLKPVAQGATNNTISMGKASMMHLRAGFEGIISKHFGREIIDELFDRYLKEAESSNQLQSCMSEAIQLFVVLKRK